MYARMYVYGIFVPDLGENWWGDVGGDAHDPYVPPIWYTSVT
jgi:hypothetical protein